MQGEDGEQGGVDRDGTGGAPAAGAAAGEAQTNDVDVRAGGERQHEQRAAAPHEETLESGHLVIWLSGHLIGSIMVNSITINDQITR